MFALALQSYLIGSIPFSQIVAALWKGIDLRVTGTGNVGATNVFQQIGLVPGLLAAVADAGKGLLAALLGNLSAEYGGFVGLIWAMIGHNWSVWLGFHGGGGLATFIGGMLVVADWWAVAVLLAVWGIAYLLVREHNRSAILACSMAPLVLGRLYESWSHFFFGLTAGLVVGFKRYLCLKGNRINPRKTP
ncbi:MAG: glycerol-3-phosphate acyltransferase [Firmicutes bacterium]|nr:glycerol-3-phosphate acyltransferase [Bacillota bacterium]